MWVDADACPVVIRNILFRAAQRTGVKLTFIANQPVATPPAPNITSIQVPCGFDIADNEIIKRASAGDLVITSDIPLADKVITKGAYALNPRGELYCSNSIKARLNMRDFMDNLRSIGVQTGGQPVLSQSDRQTFANHLDTLLSRHA